jgi:iron complex outermembrane receptor protein
LALEVADTYTLGAVWSPNSVEGLSVSLDYYNIELDDAIQYIRGAEAFNLCFATGKAGGFCDGIERSNQGDVTHIKANYYNVAAINTSGYDINLSYSIPHDTPWGWHSSFEFSVIASKLDAWEIDLGRGVSADCSGHFGTLCKGVVAEYRSLTRLQYRSGPLAAALSWQWLDGVDSDNELRPPEQHYDEAVAKLDSENYLDFNLSLDLSDAATLSFTVTNLTDNSPPLLGGNAISMNTDPGTYDVLGRRYQARFNIRF